MTDKAVSIMLSEILETIENGSRPKGGVGSITEGIPSIGGEHLTKNGDFEFKNIRYIPNDFFKKTNRGRINTNDILIVKDGATTGKTSFVSKNFPYREAAINEHVFLLRPCLDRAVPKYIFYYLYSSNGQQQVLSCFHGAAIGGITQEFTRVVKFPLPPLPEQRRIVSILDKADELRRLRRQVDKRTEELIPALFYEMFGDPGRKKFPLQNLGEIAGIVSGVTKGRKFSGKKTVIVPYLRVANVQAGFLDLSEIKSIEALLQEVDELSLQKGDILLTEGGDFDKLGRGAIWEADIENCIHQNHVFRVRFEKSGVLSLYFHCYLQTPFVREYFLRCAKKTSNLASINMTQLRALPVLIPPLPLQRVFSSLVSSLRSLESLKSRSRARLDDLFQSLLQRAFKGEL